MGTRLKNYINDFSFRSTTDTCFIAYFHFVNDVLSTGTSKLVHGAHYTSFDLKTSQLWISFWLNT